MRTLGIDHIGIASADLGRHIERKTAKGAGRDAGEVEYEEMEW